MDPSCGVDACEDVLGRWELVMSEIGACATNRYGCIVGEGKDGGERSCVLDIGGVVNVGVVSGCGRGVGEDLGKSST